MKKESLIFLAIFGLFVACTDWHNPEFVKETPIDKQVEVTSPEEYDEEISSLAKAFQSVLHNNPDARVIVHTKALEKTDGAYDVLFNTILNEEVVVTDPFLATKGFEKATMESLLNTYYDSHSVLLSKSSGLSVIEELEAKYPDLQISVPVHAEEWDPQNYMPVVCFLPSDYDESYSSYVPGYDENGNPVELDSYEEPSVPVIVISQNERNGIHPRIIAVDSPTNLSSTITETSILLNWGRVNNANGYKIWRKGPSETSFSQIGLSYGEYNSSFEDSNITALSYYQYYVTAYSEVIDSTGLSFQFESDPSNHIIVRAPGVPAAVDNLSLTMVTSNSALLMWDNNQSSSNVKVDYMVPGIVNSFYTLTTLTNGESDYIAILPFRGFRHVFRVNRTNAMGVSNSKYDFCYYPYRNINATSSVYVKRVSYTGSVENWAQGPAEFRLKVYYCNESHQTHVQDVELDFTSRQKSQNFSGKISYSWSVTNYLKDWYSSLYLYLYEKDGNTSNHHISISPEVAVKAADSLELSFSAGSISFDINDLDEVLGGNNLYYFQNPEVELSYSNYGGKLTLSETDN